MERRRYRHKQKIQAAMIVQEEALKERHQTGGKNSVKSTSIQERTPTMTAPPTGTHNIPLLASLYESCRSIRKVNLSRRTKEATLIPTVAGSVT